MGTLTEKGISGLVGSIVLYTMNGKNYVRSRPRLPKKKRGAKARPDQQIFGIISKYGTLLIKSMAGYFRFPFSLVTYNGLRGWMRNQYAVHADEQNWPLQVKANIQCQMNPEADLRDFLGFEISVSDEANGKIKLKIPAMTPTTDLRAPARCNKVNIKVIALSSSFKETGKRSNLCIEQYAFNYGNVTIPTKNILLDTKAAGDIVLVVIGLEFETAETGVGNYVTEKKWLPAAIVAMGRLG